jgi:hypothetical protein
MSLVLLVKKSFTGGKLSRFLKKLILHLRLLIFLKGFYVMQKTDLAQTAFKKSKSTLSSRR